MSKLTLAELDAQTADMLPAKETLFFDDYNWAAVYGSNSSLALNAVTAYSSAHSEAWQAIDVMQSN